MVYCVMPQQGGVSINVRKLDKCDNKRIQGACIEIRDQYGRTAQATTNVAGLVSFTLELGMSYTLYEVHPAEGYLPSAERKKIKVDDKGNITLNGEAFVTNDPCCGMRFIDFFNEPVCGCGVSDMICYVIAEQPAQGVYAGGCECPHRSCSCC
jgi:hypothetical protein